ncbi:MAG: hypothetical protein OEZ02_10475 [Anaerolineae bacterium]|nr:hypothetical protein [Anaerolineae bacterium]
MEFYFGGYYLIEGSLVHEKIWMDQKILPPILYTPSNCICELYPNVACLGWVKQDRKTTKKFRNKLSLNKREFAALQNKVDKWFDEGKYGWGSLFLDLDAAKVFAKQYLGGIQNIKLIAIAASNKDRELFLEEEMPGNLGTAGNYLALERGEVIDIKSGFRGYEILGFEMGSFHSFICYSLEKEFNHVLNLSLNQYGLLNNYDDACRASDYVLSPDSEVYPYLWQPWAIIEIPI